MSDVKPGCNSCGDDSEEGVSPEAYPITTSPMPMAPRSSELTTCIISSALTTYPTKKVVSQCSSCDTPDQPIACIELKTSTAMPACNAETILEFSLDVSKLAVGINLWAVGVGFLRIISIPSVNQLRVKNLCEAQNLSPGSIIPARTCFAWGIPYAAVLATTTNNTGPFLDSPGFIVPAVNACSVAKVKNPAGLATGQSVSLAGYNYRVGAQIDSLTYSLCNDNNGAVPNSIIQADANCDGQLDWPLVILSEADVCTAATVTSAVVVGCTTSGLRKIAGSSRCDTLRWNPTIAQWSAERLFTSPNSGAHYIDFNPLSCEWSLVYAPDLLGSACTTLVDGLNLDPLNTTNVYSVPVASTTGLSIGRIVRIAGLDFDLVAIILAGTPGTIRLTPRFVVTTVQTIPSASTICIVDEQCPAFASSTYPANIGAVTLGQPVYCAGDGLRTLPSQKSNIGANGFSLPAPININPLGIHDSAIYSVVIANPSPVLPAHVHLNIQGLSDLTINDDGRWRYELLIGNNVPPTQIVKSARINMPPGTTSQWPTSFQLNYNEVFGLLPGETRTFNFRFRVDTNNASVQNPNAEWSVLESTLHYSVNSYIP